MPIDQTSNTEIVGFLEVDNRSIISTEYKDTPQYRSIVDRTSNTEIVGFQDSTQPTERNLTAWLDNPPKG